MCCERFHSDALHTCLQGRESAVQVDLLWGLTPGQGKDGQGIDNSPNLDGDPAGTPVDVLLTHDSAWDPSDPKTQAQIFTQLSELSKRGDIFTSVTNNPLST
jgi:hypothetical protein